MNVFKILIVFLCLPIMASAQIENEKFKPYFFMGYSQDIPETHNYGGFHYTNIHNTVPDNYFGSFYQSGMMHTWYRPTAIYDLDDYDRDLYGYHAMEGGAGYKPYNHFHNELTPHKFTMGGVAGGFGSYSNGPGQGAPGFNNSAASSTLRWEENRGRYGAAVLSNRLLFPLDGVGFEGRANNKMFGYGYYALPLTAPKSTTAGENIPTGNHCWTLFFNTENFSGPVAFHTPYHWSKYSLTQENAVGKCFDNSLLKRSPIFQRETNNLPAKKWTDTNGDIYYKCSPVFMPVDEDGIGRLGTMPMQMDNTLWNAVSNWFDGGNAVPQNFDQQEGAVHIRTNTAANPSFKFDAVNIQESSFATRISDPEDPHAVAFQWKSDLIEKVEGRDLIRLPSYYVLRNESTQAIAISEEEVPDESGLKEINSRAAYEEDWDFEGFNRDDIFTPMHPDFTYSDDIVDVWKSPGPTSGPYYTELDDGSTAVYYWYKFNEQPSILNSDMDETERALVQKRVELLHKNWNTSDSYLPEPNKEKVSLDHGLLLTPPPGLEVGYVPVCVHQQLTTKELPEFPEINVYTPPLQVYIIAGQSNAVGLGQIANEQLPGTLAYTLANDTTGSYDFLDDGNGGYVAQDDVWMYYERDGTLLTGDMAPGYGNDATKMGMEVTFGERMQKYTKQQVLVIKAAWGGKNLAVDFRPPSSGGETGVYYQELLRVVNDALDNLSNYYPDYDTSIGYEIAGLAWHQGWNDHVNASFTAEYTENMANLIKDLRADLGVNFPVAIATTAMPKKVNAFEENTIYKPIELAQLAIADTSLYPEFEGNVAVVDAKKYWISPTLSPSSGGGQHFHWNQNAKTYMDIGLGLADALFMIKDTNTDASKLVSYKHNAGGTNPSWVASTINASSALGGKLSGGQIETTIDQLSASTATGLATDIPSNDFEYYCSYTISSGNKYAVQYDRLALIASAEDTRRNYQLSYSIAGQEEVFITNGQVPLGTPNDETFDSYTFTDFATALDVEFRVYWQGSGTAAASSVFIDQFDLYGSTGSIQDFSGVTLFQDTFDRADSDELNSSTEGQSGVLSPATYATQIYDNVEFGIKNNAVSIDGPTASGDYGALCYLDAINFSSSVIDPNLLFSVQIDINQYSTSGSSRQMGVGIGQSLEELATQSGAGPNTSNADLFVGYRGTTNTLEIYKNGVLDSEESVTGALPVAPATMRIECEPDGFEKGNAVEYQIYFNEDTTPFATGSFLWSGTNENYLSLSSNLTNESLFDNLVVKSFEDRVLNTSTPVLPDHTAVTLYPNPFDDGFRVAIPAYDGSSTIQLTLMDITGQIVLQENYQQRSIDITKLTLPKGLYLLNLSYNHGKHFLVKKLLKL